MKSGNHIAVLLLYTSDWYLCGVRLNYEVKVLETAQQWDVCQNALTWLMVGFNQWSSTFFTKSPLFCKCGFKSPPQKGFFCCDVARIFECGRGCLLSKILERGSSIFAYFIPFFGCVKKWLILLKFGPKEGCDPKSPMASSLCFCTKVFAYNTIQKTLKLTQRYK